MLRHLSGQANNETCLTAEASNLQLIAKDRRPQDAKLVHVRSSGLKAAATWHRVEILQACRECCGGMGARLVFASACFPGRCPLRKRQTKEIFLVLCSAVARRLSAIRVRGFGSVTEAHCGF